MTPVAGSTGTPVDERTISDEPSFDVRAFTRSPIGSLRGTLDLEAYVRHPLPAEVLDELRFLEAAERGTMIQLRTVLVAPTHKDARVTAFLVTWAFERHWLADALRAVIEAHEPRETAAPARDETAASGLGFPGARFAPLGHAVVTNLLGTDVTSVHTASGLVDDWAAIAVYDALAEHCEHQELRRTLNRIVEVRRRHAEFFAEETRRRLTGRPLAVHLTRWRLRHLRWPLGAGADAPARDVRRYLRRLAQGRRGAAVDERLAELPGLADLRPMAIAATRVLRAAGAPVSKGPVRGGPLRSAPVRRTPTSPSPTET